MIEELEHLRIAERRAETGALISAAADSSSGVLSANGTEFTYTTPTGGKAVIQIVGLGNLGGTTVNSAGALNLVYDGTNAFSKIVSHVKGGNGRAPLASILNGQLIAAGAENSISGVGGNVIEAVYLSDFNLIAGGNINLTSGVNTLVLDSVGPDTQVHLRELPPAPSTTTSAASIATVGIVATQGGETIGLARDEIFDLEHFFQCDHCSRSASRRPSQMKFPPSYHGRETWQPDAHVGYG